MKWDDESIKKMRESLDNYLKSKNTLTVEEFKEFYPLFKKDQLEQMDEQQRAELSDRYAERIDLFTEVNIVQQTETGEFETVMTLPPMFTRTSVVNETSIDGVNPVDFYSTAMKDDKNPVSQLPEKATLYMSSTLNKALIENKDKYKEEFDKFANIMDELSEKVVKENNDKPEPINLDDFEWEDEE